MLRPLRAFTLLCAFVAVGPALAAPAADAAESPGEVRAWLLRIHQAASRNNFQGTFVVSGGGNVTSARIAHFCKGAEQFERIESLDGRERTVYRPNDVVHTLWPDARVAVVEQRELLISFPALLESGGEGVADHYDVQAQGEDRVAGHAADVLLVRPKDAHRYGYRLWADKATGLLLRADVLEAGGQVLETSSFSDVEIGIKSQPASVLRPMKRLAGYRVVHPELTPTRLQDEGWSMRKAVPGFREVRCVRRAMDMAAGDALDDDSGRQRVLQVIYSDGLTYVSVFIEPFRPGRRERPMLTAIGATGTLMLRRGDWFITVVGDTPAPTLRLFADALQRTR
jgi:sigma-E factor negative regulatory protein RseB